MVRRGKMSRCGCVFPTALSVSVIRVSNVSTVLFLQPAACLLSLSHENAIYLNLLTKVLLRMKYAFGGSFSFAAFGMGVLSPFLPSCRGLQQLINFKRCTMKGKKTRSIVLPRHRPSTPQNKHCWWIASSAYHFCCRAH